VLVLLFVAAAAGCAGKKATPVTYADAEQQYREARAQIESDRLNQAKASLQNIQFTNPQEQKTFQPLVRLATADATFYQGNDLALIDARNLYLDFVTLNGDHQLAPYAQFQAGMCSLEQAVDPAKDQTETFQAIDDFREVERRYPNSDFAAAAEVMRQAAQANLAEHSFEVGRFYYKRKRYLAALDRFREVLERYPEYDRIDRVYNYMGRSLLRTNNEAEARIYLEKLIADFPNSEASAKAQKFIEKHGLELDQPAGQAP
jgi:outer membrane protein assembly factor BamD